MISRSSVALRTAQSTRRAMSTQPSMWTPNEEAAKRFVEARHETFEHAGKSADMWRKVSLYVLIPAGIVLGAYMYKVESKHLAHAKHVYEENDHSLPERPDYEYLNIKAKRFPWGQQSLFFNPLVNHPSPEM